MGWKYPATVTTRTDITLVWIGLLLNLFMNKILPQANCYISCIYHMSPFGNKILQLYLFVHSALFWLTVNNSITLCPIWLFKLPNEACWWAGFNGTHNFGVTWPLVKIGTNKLFYFSAHLALFWSKDNNSIIIYLIGLSKVPAEVPWQAGFNDAYYFGLLALLVVKSGTKQIICMFFRFFGPQYLNNHLYNLTFQSVKWTVLMSWIQWFP